MKHFIKGWLLIAGCLTAGSRTVTLQAQTGQQTIRIGDHLDPMMITDVLNSKSPLKLPENGKAVLIDFFGTYCGPCVHALENLDALQAKFSGQLQVIVVSSEEKERVKSFLLKYIKKHPFKFPLVYADTALIQRFPHQQIPHEVWIDKTGRIQAITDHEAVTAKNIEALLKGAPLQLALKDDYGTGAVSHTAEQPGFSRYIGGNQHGFSRKRDSVQRTTQFHLYNVSPLEILQMVYKKDFIRYRKRVHISEGLSDIFFKPDSVLTSAWNPEHLFCYQQRFAGLVPDATIWRQVLRDAWSYFGIHTSMDTVRLPCLVLKSISSDTAHLTSDTLLRLEGTLRQQKSGWRYEHSNLYISELVSLLNRKSETSHLPWVIDESNIKKPFNLRLNIGADPSDIESWSKALKPYGLALIYEDRSMPIFMIEKAK
ncbi:MAG: TlpA disulfide reductase family protein [Chitinophagaceae bacterium]